MLTNKSRKVFYVGVTDNLIRRIWEHINGMRDGFTKRYNVYKLVYFEEIKDIEVAMAREKRLKRWNRNWKIELVEKETQNGMIYMVIFVMRNIYKITAKHKGIPACIRFAHLRGV